MHYIFDFLLVSCLTVGVVTTIFAFAIFFRYKSRLEYYFLAFLACFTLRVIADAAIFLLFPRLPASGLLYLVAFVSRISLVGTMIFLSLFMHKLTGILQSPKARAATSIVVCLIVLAFTVQFALDYGRRELVYADPNAFLPVDLVFYFLPVYPVVVFFAFSRRIKDLALFSMIRTLIIMTLVTFPLLLLEDVFGGVLGIFGADRHDPEALRLFPLCYLMIYVYFLVAGFRNFFLERSLASAPAVTSREFIDRFGITGREQEVIALMREGLSNKRIAERLFISTATVKNHFHNIFEKTGAVNRVELIRLSSR